MSKNIPDLIKKFVDADELRKQMEKCAKDQKELVDAMKEELIAEFIEQGVQKMSAHGRTVYLTNSFSAKPVEGIDYKVIANAMVGTDMQGLITVNARSLTSYVKDEIEQYMVEHELDMADDLNYDDMMPNPLKGKLDIGVFTQIASRKG